MTDPIMELAREIVLLQLDWIKNVDGEWYAKTPVEQLDEAEASEIVQLLRSRLNQVGWIDKWGDTYSTLHWSQKEVDIDVEDPRLIYVIEKGGE